MIPPRGSPLPEGSDPSFVENLREHTTGSSEAGALILVENDSIIGTKTWIGTPILLVLEFFGKPFNRHSYVATWKLRAVIDGMPYVTAFDAGGRIALIITSEQKDLEKMIHVLNRQKS